MQKPIVVVGYDIASVGFAIIAMMEVYVPTEKPGINKIKHQVDKINGSQTKPHLTALYQVVIAGRYNKYLLFN